MSKPKRFTLWTFTENVCWPLVFGCSLMKAEAIYFSLNSIPPKAPIPETEASAGKFPENGNQGLLNKCVNRI